MHRPVPAALARRRAAYKDTIDGFEILQQRGLIRHWGVSNFDLADMRELHACPGGTACSTNQVWYSLSERGVEFDLLAWQRVHQMPLMAYSPIDQGELVDHPALRVIAERTPPRRRRSRWPGCWRSPA